MKGKNPILTTKDLQIGYGNKIIAQELDLEINVGEIICLFGQNGVGKSTLLRTLSNLQESLAGEIHIAHKSIGEHSNIDLAKLIGIVTTESISVANMTVRDLVALGRYPYTNWLGSLDEKDKEIIENAINLCKINYISNQTTDSISDGQKQKAMIARALSQDTKIIMLDEPTAHLDVINSAEIMILLNQLKKDKAIVISTHDINLAMQFADKIWLMDFNKEFISGTTEDLALAGSIQESFYQKEFKIDILNGKIHQNQDALLKINLIGSGEALDWTKHALERSGYEIDASANLVVEIEYIDKVLSWKLSDGSQKITGQSIDGLLNQLTLNFSK